MFKYAASFDTLRSADTSAIGTNYATIGTALSSEAVVIAFKNLTNGDVLVSTDGSNNMLIFPSGGYAVYDIRTNAPMNTDFMFRKGTQFYVKDGSTVGSSGSFYIEAVIVTDIPFNSVA